MKMRNYFLKLTLCTILLFTFTASITFADVGNGVSHEEPSNDSYSSEVPSTSSYSSNEPSTGSYSSSEGSGEDLDLWYLIYFVKNHPVLAIIGVIVFFLLKKYRKTSPRRRTTPTRTSSNTKRQPTYRTADLTKLKEKDPLFSDELFLSKVGNMFIQLQQAWMNKDWNSIRPFETDSLFQMHHRQLQSYIEQHKTNVVENIAIIDSKIVRYEHDSQHDEVDVYIKVRMNDYVIDDHTKKVLKGNPNKDIYMTYIWTLIRKDTVLTDEKKEQYEVTQCPNCGANVSINASGQCDYCESIISSGEYNWVLSKIKVVRQQ